MALGRKAKADYRTRAAELLREALAVTEPQRLGALIQELKDRRKLVQDSLRDITTQTRRLRSQTRGGEDSKEIYSLLEQVPSHRDELDTIADAINGLTALKDIRGVLQVAEREISKPVLTAAERAKAASEAAAAAAERAAIARARPVRVGKPGYAKALEARVGKLEGAVT